MSDRIKTALPGQGRGTLSLLERSLVSVRKRGKMSKDTAPHTYHRAPIKHPHSSTAQLLAHSQKEM